MNSEKSCLKPAVYLPLAVCAGVILALSSLVGLASSIITSVIAFLLKYKSSGRPQEAIHELDVWALLLNNCSAGQPSSFCLQYLQANEPLNKAFPHKESTVKITINTNISQVKSMIKAMIPPTRGKIRTKKSGIKSFHEISVSVNLSGSPFLKNRGDSLPLPRPQNLP